MKSIQILIVSAILTIIAPPTSYSQSRQDDRFAVGTNLVSLNVSVTDSRGKFVGGLSREHFEVLDDSVNQEVAFFSNSNAPTIFGFVYDMHPSTVERTTDTLRALKQFVQTLHEDESFFLLAFDERGSLALDFIPSYEQVQLHLPMSTQKGVASLYDAVYLAAGKLRESSNPKRALLIISDGADHNSKRSYKDVRSRISGFDVQIYSIGIDTSSSASSINSGRWTFEDVTRGTRSRTFMENTETVLGRAVLDELARVSGGTANLPEAKSPLELTGICAQIAFEIRTQYAIGFYPTDSTGESKWHRLNVRVRPLDRVRGQLTLSHRQGYQSFPAPK